MTTTHGNLVAETWASSADTNRNLNPSNVVPTAGVDYPVLNGDRQAPSCEPREQRCHTAQLCTIVKTAQATA
jgi:hypothetical protein